MNHAGGRRQEKIRKGIFLLLFGIGMLFVFTFTFYRSLATDVSVQIGNVAPTVVSAFLHASSFIFTEQFNIGTPVNVMIPGSTGALYGNGRVEDLNGRDDIVNVRGVFYRSSVSGGSDCTADNNGCYVVSSCTLRDLTGNDLRKEYSCRFDLSAYIDSTDSDGHYSTDTWNFFVEVSDGTAIDSESVTTEVSSLLSLDIPSSINYGVLGLGDKTPAGSINITVTQQGNVRAGVEISGVGTAMNCSGRGSIPRENQEYSTESFTHGTGIDLSGTPISTGMVLGWQETDTAVSDDLYFGIEIPSSGVEGICSMVNTLTAASLD
ncbi:TPA: hypothetical protein DEP34_00195 [Candidatus Uhrbacteria bacterium]|uniref:Uncharacterized protein n=2 Tax=Candidatus Uhriibacteriota TaxID=1752732 RepID=A0A0G1T8T1_9BACT|nr:MAG: hypothetical protein UX45_C0002G0040 [Candidatus Uhrbacteria bacterium GW2011_GWF2_46_218]KKU41815.1 MAG: hypothetical protein UX57_C0001G0039 [Candidatus Uhrbacteria bacterium GW2011_GWE2_46_68]HBK34135.1 hypothetical protein [Candidatus Uhrbacteria bacterium]HCB18793.1 hypothetical protein [Candidatus Uhrbacteria bacterium]